MNKRINFVNVTQLQSLKPKEDEEMLKLLKSWSNAIEENKKWKEK